MDEIPMGIGNDLELDVMRIDHELFQIAVAISEGSQRFIRRGAEQGDEFFLFKARTHPAATTTGGRFDHDREPHFFRFDQRGFRAVHQTGSRRDRHTVGNSGRTSGRLITHQGNDLRGRSDERDPRSCANFRKAGVFGKETVARVNRVRTRDLRRGDDPVGLQIRFLAGRRSDANRLISELNVHRIDIRFGINRNGFDIQLAAGADDAESNFAAIGDQDTLEHGKVC